MKETRIRNIRVMLMCSVAVVIFLSLGTVWREYYSNQTSRLNSLSAGWYYIQDNQKVYVELPAQIELSEGENLELYYDDLPIQYSGQTVLTRGAFYRMKIQLGNRVLYSYSDQGFARNMQMRTKLKCKAEIPEKIQNTQLKLTYYNQGSRKFDINRVYIGTGSAAFSYQFYSDIITLLVVFTMGVIGVACAGAHLYLKRVRVAEQRIGNTAWFLLLCGAWYMLDSAFMQQISNQSPMVAELSFFAFMTMLVPMLHFVRNTADMRRFVSLDFCENALYLNIVVQVLLHVAFGVQYIHMLFITHILQAVSCSVGMYLMHKEYVSTGNRELRAVLQSIFLLAGATCAELLFYWTLKVPCYGLIFAVGILVFIVRLLGAIVDSMASSLKFKAEAMIYKKLSREDRLTGLQNRQAFEETLAELEMTVDRYRNVALIFMDVNGLKDINDNYGHNAGDELLIGAARCIKEAFIGKGSYYRIGGDEFAVIILDPPGSKDIWENMLEQEITQYNTESRYHLSIAHGISFLRNGKGEIKKISDWKQEADIAMYQNKKLQKEKERISMEAAGFESMPFK